MENSQMSFGASLDVEGVSMVMSVMALQAAR